MILTVSVLAALASQTQEPGFYALGRDHAQFARALYREGFADMVDNYCKQVEAVPGLDPRELAGVTSVHLDVQVDIASQLSDPLKRKDEFSRIVKAKEAFIAAYPDTPEARDADERLPEVYRLLGEAYTGALQKTSDAEQMTQLRAEGNEIFQHSEEALKRRVETLGSLLSNPNLTEEQSTKLNDQAMTASYNLARTFYFHSMLLGTDDVLRGTYLKRCVTLFNQFSLDYGDYTLNFSGLVFRGLAHHALGQDEDALADFDECIAVRDSYTLGPDGQYHAEDADGKLGPLPQEIADVISSGVRQKVQLLADLKRHDEALAAVEDFLKTIPDALKTDQGLAILNERMDVQMATGDTKAAAVSAQMLVDNDPSGYWGAQGRSVLGNLLAGGGAASLDQKNVLRIAESLAAKADYEQAITLCNQVVANLRASGQQSSELADAYILIGNCFLRVTPAQLERASVAYDAAVQSDAAGARAGDALNAASNAYRSLYQKQKKAFFKKRADDRLQTLARSFPQHPKAAEVQLTQARELEDNGQFAEAGARYLAVTPESPVYGTAQFKAGYCLYQEAARLAKDKKADEAKATVGRAEEQLRKAQQVLEAAAGKTLDLKQQSDYQSMAYQTRTTLGELYMLDGVGREKDVLAITQEIETKYPGDDDKIGAARSLRVSALTALGKTDEAKSFLEGLVTKDPGSKATATAAGVLARTFDQQAQAAFDKDPKSGVGADLWKQAFRYYTLSLQPRLSDPVLAQTGRIEDVANRFFLMGLFFNNAPGTTFVGWPDTKRPAPEYWEKAAEFYEATLANAPSYSARVSLARTDGFLGRWKEAVDLFGKVIEDEAFIDTASAKQDINRSVLSAKKELLGIYLELGVARMELAHKDNDTEQIRLAASIFDKVGKAAAKNSETWWQAKYHQVVAMMDLGDYKTADVTVRDLERTTQDYDGGQWGLNALFKKLKAELDRKVPK